MCGNWLKVRFTKIINKDGGLFGVFSVVSPKKVMYLDKVVDLTKLGELSENEPIFIGPLGKRDSLYTSHNTTRTWVNGHIGHFNIFSSLLSSDDERIRKTLGVDGFWDGEWGDEDIIRGDEKVFVEARVKELRESGELDPTTYWHCPHITMVNPTGIQYEWVGENLADCGGYFPVDFNPHQVFELCAQCKIKARNEPVDVVGDSFLVRPEDRKVGKVTLIVGQVFENQEITRYDAKLIEGYDVG